MKLVLHLFSFFPTNPLKWPSLSSSQTIILHLATTSAAIGVNYGTLGNLPQPSQVVRFLKTKTNIDDVKIFSVDPEILGAFANTGISITVAVPNGDIMALSTVRQARRWVAANIIPFYPQTKVKYICVGNEILLSGDDNLIGKLLPAMRSLNCALIRAGINGVKVTSAHSLNIVAYEINGAPSRGRFRPGWDKGVLAPMLAFHRHTSSPFMVNPYPYHGFGFDPKNVNFATFKPNPGLIDPFTGLTYTNMFDALLDTTYSAMKSLGYDDVDIVIGETGWPSACDAAWCSPDTAAWFNRNVMQRATGGSCGTPLMPNRRFETFIFGLFNEDGKPGPTAERNWGLFRPDFTPVYEVGVVRDGREPVVQPAGGKWCVAKQEATEAQLQSNLDWVSGHGGVDCKPVQTGGACFEPNNVRAHASYVMNLYYQTQGRADGACDFTGTGVITDNDPSRDECKYIS